MKNVSETVTRSGYKLQASGKVAKQVIRRSKARLADLRLCRPDDNGAKESSHYWDVVTGDIMPEPKGARFTPECLCPEHSALLYGKL